MLALRRASSLARTFNGQVIRTSATASAAAGAHAGEVAAKGHFSRHWYFERGLAVALLTLIPAAVFVPSAPVDYAIGVVVPIHAYLGFESMIVDYLPKHKFPVVNRLAFTGVGLATLTTLYGLYQLNANDIGITKAFKKLWSLH